MDIEQERVFEAAAPSLPQADALPSAGTSLPAWPTPTARAVMPVYSVEEQLRKRGLRRMAGRLALVLFDTVIVNIAFFVGYLVRYEALRGVRLTTQFVDEPFSTFRNLELLVTVGILAALMLKGLYRLRLAGAWFKQFWVIISATTTAFAVFSAYDYIVQKTDVSLDSRSRSLVTFTWIAIVILLSLSHLFLAFGQSTLYRRGIGLTNLLVVGSGRLGKLMMQQIAATPDLGYRVVGFIHDLDGPPADFGRFKVLGTMHDLDAVIRGNRIAEVIIALPSHQHRQILRTVRLCERAGADFKLVPDLYELSLSRIDVDAIEGIPLIGLRRTLTNSWHYKVKRLIDIVGAALVLLIGSPLWLIIALAIKLDSPGPVLLRQTRLGYRGQPFGCFKLRSMHLNADQMMERMRAELPEDERGKFKLRDDPRRTRVGRLIRKLSLDEVPQILNVLTGDMSLVGPRPPLPSEYQRYEDWEKARLEVTPGMTGLWQVRGRSDIDFDEMVLMDLYYIENWSLRLDIQIMLQTIPAVLSRRGAY